jgi:hypothetical protein
MVGVFAHFQQRSAKSVKSSELAAPFHVRRRGFGVVPDWRIFCAAASVVSCFFPPILERWK